MLEVSTGTTASGSGDGFVLDGTKTVVIHGAQAAYLIVSARSAGEQRESGRGLVGGEGLEPPTSCV